MRSEVIPAGDSVQLFSDGIPGFGSLNGLFLLEQKYGGQFVPVTKPITRHDGEVRLPSGRLLDVSLRDVLPPMRAT